MASSVINSDDGVISGTSGLKSSGGDDGVLVFQSKGTETARINTDKQIVAAAGTASLPALTTTGDLNTGIFFPAADTIAFGEGGAEAMRINSSGNVGIGTSSPSVILDVRRAVNSDFVQFVGSSSAFVMQSNASSIDLIGVTSALNAAQNVFIRPSGVGQGLYINTIGEVIAGGTTDQGAYNLQCNGTGVWGAGAYVNGSDERIKDDIAPLASGLDVIEKLNPVTYRYKEEWSKDQNVQPGFIAQELLTALDGQVYVDGVVQQGGANSYYSVAYQNLIPILTKAIQELSAKNDALEARIAALEAVPGNE
jgi:cell division protein FtsB